MFSDIHIGTSQFNDASATQLRIYKNAASGIPLIDLNPMADDGISAAQIRLFRETNTVGTKQVLIYKGDGSAVHAFDLVGGKVVTYNNLPTEGYGVPAIVDVVHLAATTNIAKTAMSNTGYDGLYRVSYYFETTTPKEEATTATLIIYHNDDVNYDFEDIITIDLTVNGDMKSGTLFFHHKDVGDSISIYYSLTSDNWGVEENEAEIYLGITTERLR